MEHREEALRLLGAWEQLSPGPQARLLGAAQGLAELEPVWLRCPAIRPQSQTLHLGDRVRVYPTFGGRRECQWGTVIYIHPRRRYYTVALERGSRQAFPWGAAE